MNTKCLRVLMFLFHFPVDVRFFSRSLERYHKQHKMSLEIPEQCHLGLLLIDAVKMKGLLIPSPIRCLNVSTKNQNEVVLNLLFHFAVIPKDDCFFKRMYQ